MPNSVKGISKEMGLFLTQTLSSKGDEFADAIVIRWLSFKGVLFYPDIKVGRFLVSAVDTELRSMERTRFIADLDMRLVEFKGNISNIIMNKFDAMRAALPLHDFVPALTKLCQDWYKLLNGPLERYYKELYEECVTKFSLLSGQEFLTEACVLKLLRSKEQSINFILPKDRVTSVATSAGTIHAHGAASSLPNSPAAMEPVLQRRTSQSAPSTPLKIKVTPPAASGKPPLVPSSRRTHCVSASSAAASSASSVASYIPNQTDIPDANPTPSPTSDIGSKKRTKPI